MSAMIINTLSVELLRTGETAQLFVQAGSYRVARQATRFRHGGLTLASLPFIGRGCDD